MKITQRTGDRLVLAGIPGGRGAMLAATAIGLAIIAAVSAFAVLMYNEQGLTFAHIALGFGVLIGAIVFATGIVTLLVARERLTLDRTTGTLRYESRSPIVDVPKPFECPLERVASIVLDRTIEHRETGADNTHAGTVEVWTARLRTTSPRRSVTLDLTENGNVARVRTLAEAVSGFLCLPLTGDTTDSLQ